METSYMARSASQPSQLSYMSASSSCVLLEPEDRRYARLEGRLAPRTPRCSLSSAGSGRRRRRRCWLQVFIVASFVLSLCSLASFVAMFAWMRMDSSAPEPLCLPCLSIVTSPILESDPRLTHLLRMREDGRDLCCAATRQQEVQLLEMVMRRKDEENQITAPARQNGEDTTQQVNSSRLPGQDISAHVLLGPQPTSTHHDPDGKELVSLQSWDSTRQLSHLQGVDLLQNHTLVVRVEGRYYVYGQIYFRTVAAQPVTGLFTMHIYRFNVDLPDSEEELLRGVSSTSSQDDKFLHTTYVGGVFRLKHGDQLFVKASHPDLISKEAKASFLGLFKVSS